MDKKEEDFLKKLLSLFKVEAQEHVKAISSGLVELEKATAQRRVEILETIYREAHSLKGAAHTVNLLDIKTICQSMESVFAALKREEIIASPQLFDTLHRVVDAISKLISRGEGGNASEIAEIKELLNTLMSAASVQPISQASAQDAPEMTEIGQLPAQTSAPEKPLAEEAKPAKTEGLRPSSSAPKLTETIRISIAKLDSLLLQAEELLSVKLASAQRAAELRETRASFALWKKGWVKAYSEIQRLLQSVGKKGQQETDSSQPGKLTAFLDLSNEHIASLENKLTSLERSADYDHKAFGGMVDNLLDDMKKVLMLSASSLLDIFPKFVRDLSRDMGKEVDIITQGGEIEIDRRILEEMKDPLIHLVRNCIDHGIEKPYEREQKKKPRRGNIGLAVASKNGSKVEIMVSDDGAGIDASEVKSAAIKRGILSRDESAKLSDQEALLLAFQSGVTTSLIITDVSGRGLGLAIVQEKVEKLNGMVALDTQPGVGTTFRIVVPLTLATFRGLLVRLDEHLFVLPITNVERAMRVTIEDVKTVENRETLSLNGQVISLIRLGDMLNLPGDRKLDSLMQVVVLGLAEKRIAFLVDEVLYEQEVLVKTMGKQLSRIRNIAGATVLGNGKVVPILNVPDLIKSAVKVSSIPAGRPSEEVKVKTKSILVVEDSITSRTLLKNILDSAGYHVRTAVDGLDAFAALKTQEFDLVVSDVQMPRMDGFALVVKIRADSKLAELPIVLVTALETREDRERGIDVGANAYIVKSSFDQSNLLETVRRLI